MTKLNLYPFIFIFFFLTGIVSQSVSQISQGGTPYSFINKDLPEEFEVLNFQKPDIDKIKQEDALAELDSPWKPRIGVAVQVNKGINDAGTWTELSDGSKIWRLKLSCPDARALAVNYDDFQLPEGGELYLYNENKKQVIGAFTSFNNSETGVFATQMIQGEKVTLEYYQPEWVNEMPGLNISHIGYIYRNVSFKFSSEGERGAWWCMINVACEEGDNWRDEIKGAAKILMYIQGSYYLCSGSLINNTSWDREPYFLTAAHCGENSSSSDRNQWVFYFKYQASTCDGNYGPSNKTVTGASLKGWDHSHGNNGSDFYLLLLNSQVPTSYDPFYNGWDRRDVPGDSGVCIHHPAGDIKKISTYDQMVSSSWSGGSETHWRVWWIETENGKSVIQGGSSGSPIFNQDKRILGDLTGTYVGNSCESPRPAMFGKIYWSWDKNGTSPEYRLKDWLDPDNTGDTVCDGIPWDDIPPIADFQADSTEVYQGDTVHFTDWSLNKPQSWTWVFEGAEVDSSFVQNPDIMYVDTGYHDVKLIVENPDGIDSLTREDYIHVGGVAPPEVDFEADTTMLEPYETTNFTDLSTGEPYAWEWTFEGGTPETSTEQNPEEIKYYASGLYDVKLLSTNGGGTDSLTKEDYINVVWVNIDENNLLQNVKLYPNPTSGKIILEITNINAENIKVDIYNTYGSLIGEYENLNYSGQYLLDFDNNLAGIYFVIITVNETRIVQRVSVIR